MADDVLRLRAEIADKLSGPLKQIQRELGSFGRGTGTGVGNVTREFNALHGVVGRFGSELKAVTIPALGALGLTGGGIVASLVGVSNVLRNMSERAIDLHNLAKETGNTVGQVKAFSRQMELLRISPEAAAAGLQTLSKNLFEVRNRLNGPMVAELRAKGGGELIAQLRTAKDSFEALNRIVDYGERVQAKYGIEGKKRFYELTLGNAEFARLNRKELIEMEVRRKKLNDELDPRAARAYLEAFQNLDHAFGKMKRTIGMELMPSLTKMIEKFDSFLEQPEGKKWLKDFGRDVGAVAESFVSLASAIEKVVAVSKYLPKNPFAFGRIGATPEQQVDIHSKQVADLDQQISEATGKGDTGAVSKLTAEREQAQRTLQFFQNYLRENKQYQEEKGGKKTLWERLFGGSDDKPASRRVEEGLEPLKVPLEEQGKKLGDRAGKSFWDGFTDYLERVWQGVPGAKKSGFFDKDMLSKIWGAATATPRIPGDVMGGKYATKPETPGQWSETDQFRSDAATRQETRDALGLSAYGAGASGGLLKNLVPESMPGLAGKLQARTPFQGRSGSRERGAESGGLGGVPRIKSPSTVPDLNRNDVRGAMGGGMGSRIARSKAAAIDQLRKEGVPEANIQEAANLLVGQQLSESGSLDPKQSHDQGTGTGIYGARYDRRDKMFNWMAEQGFKPDSLEGQSKYMAHEAMTGKAYGATREALMSADPSTRGAATHTITRNFERPGIINDRTGNVARAAGVEADATGGRERPGISGDAVPAVGGGSPDAFIFHHTAGRGTVAGVQNTLRQRGLGVQYVMDREGNITQTGGPGASHMRRGQGLGEGLSNRNTVGMEVIARNNNDVTPEQIEAARAFIKKQYPSTNVFGHGEVNPGHKEATEGMAIVNAIRGDRKRKPWEQEDRFGRWDGAGSQRMDRELARQGGPTKVEGTGTLTVDVRAPRGTKVDAEGGGIFREVKTNRQMQMEPSATGPEE